MQNSKIQSFFIIVTLLFLSFSTHAQKREFISAGIIGEISNSEKNNHSGYSLSYENQFSKNHGFEIGYNKRSVSYLIFQKNFVRNTGKC